MFARIFRDKNFFLTLLLGAQACLEPAVTTSTGELLQEQSSSSSSVQSSSVASSSSSVTSSSSSVQSSSSSSSVTSSSSMQSSLPSSSSSSSIASSSSSVTSSSSSVTSSSSSVASSSSSVQSSSSSSSSSVPTPNPGVAYKCSSITQFGITWKFNGDYSCGNFVNGDPWVVGPVTITSITRPNGSPDKDGSMLSPSTGAEWPSQGFDNTAELGYSSSLNVARQLPNLTVAADKSLISSISISAAQRPNVDARQSIDVQAILTVVGSVPPEGSFRPAYFGVHKKPYYNINQIRYERLLSLNRNSFPNAPHANDISGAFTKPRIELGGIYKSAGLMGIQNAHGAYTSLHTSTAALVLNLNISAAEKQKLAIGLIQFGIDIYGGVIVGRQYLPSAAVQNGRKIAMLLTGILLNDPAILDRANAKKYPRDFSEDMQFGTVTQSFVTTPRKPIQGRQTDPYKAGTYVVGDVYGANGMVGMPEWGGEFTDHPEMCASNWGAYYRVYVGAPLSGAALTLKLMNIGSYWNNQAFSDYFLDRYFPIEENKTETPLFFIDIWKSIK